MGTHSKVHPPVVAPIVTRSWIASGDPRQDLPSWTRSFEVTKTILVSRCVQADELTGERLAEAAREAILSAFLEMPSCPCRVWAFLPRPTDCDGDFLQRYMRFNEGRTSAYRTLPEVVTSFPASTCVGHSGSALVIHALWIPGQIVSLENTRQRPAWLYSNRFGPVSPAFVRAVIAQNALIVSGTAAVVGEDTLHESSIDLQFEESIRNLRSLALAAKASGLWRSLQIYVRDSADMDRVQELAALHFGVNIDRILHSPLCRSDLRVEIEGVCDVVGAQA